MNIFSQEEFQPVKPYGFPLNLCCCDPEFKDVMKLEMVYLAMHRWLQNFAYRIGISWWMFVFAGMLAFIIAQLTVSFQVLKAARKNPVESLQYE